MPLLLELFSGTGSVGRVFREAGWDVYSVDCDPLMAPTLCCNVARLELNQLPTVVDMIWASPPCTQYSIARTRAATPRDFEGADELVRKTLEVCDHYGCPWFMENPATGYLKRRPVVRGRPYHVISYCRYAEGNFPKYRKLTNIWTNVDWWRPRPQCRPTDLCEWSDAEGRHPEFAQRWSRNRDGRIVPGRALNILYAIPPALLREILEQWAER